MAYRKPNVFTRRVFNPVAMKLGVSGTEALSVAGRRTGKARRVPVIPIEHGGARYLVSPRGETDWAKNLRAAGEGELAGKRFTAIEVPVGERGPILDRYREVAGRAVASHFKALPDASDHPVFRIS
jgi:deazaflavin-dependent oxidoreductase (nitroreductase family)